MVNFKGVGFFVERGMRIFCGGLMAEGEGGHGNDEIRMMNGE